MAGVGKLKFFRKRNDSHKTADPDYLLNQDTFTSLTVLNGNVTDAEIGLADCSGKSEQQWLHDGNALLWGNDPSYCLVPNYADEIVTLGDAITNRTDWEHDEAERFVVGGNKAMHVPSEKPRTAVVLRSLLDTIKQKWWTYSELTALLDDAPPVVYPVPATDILTYKQELARGLNNHLTPVTSPLPYERDVATFPGVVGADAPRISKTIVLDLLILGQEINLRMTVPKDWQATNLYAVPGDVLEVVLPDNLDVEQASQIMVRISANYDFLQSESGNVVNKNKWKRMPIVTETFELSPGVNKIRGQYGGHLIFMFGEGENFTVEAEVNNVVEAPYFRLGETNVEQWQEEINRDVPQALLESDKTVVVVSKSDAVNISDPELLMSRFDEVISMLNYAAGFDDSEPPPRGKYWLVNDIQITAGSAHAGFPVMFDRMNNDLASLETPYSWVTWHELGHNYQQMDYWESAYGSESTVNLYSLYIQKQLFDEDRLETDNTYVETAEAVDAGLTFDDANVWQKLVFLMEIKYYFPEQDWEMFRQLRKTTRVLSEEDAGNLSATGNKQGRLDYVYKNLSKIVGSDLINTYNRWSIAISQEAQDEISALGLPKAPGDLSHRPADK